MRFRRDKRPSAGTPILFQQSIAGRRFTLYNDSPGRFSIVAQPDGMQLNGQPLRQRDLERGWGLASDYRPPKDSS